MAGKPNKSTEISWRDFFLGLFVGAFIVLIFAFNIVRDIYKNDITNNPAVSGTQQNGNNTADNNSGTDSKVSEETVKVYNTSIKEWTVTAADGEIFNLVTPANYYSLSDQYKDQMSNYYNVDMADDAIICVGDTTQQYSSTVLLTAAPLSKTKELIDAIYADNADVNTDEFQYSEAYTFMIKGEVPEGANVVVTELDSVTASDGKVYRMFQVDRDTEYYTDDTMTDTEVVHSVELTAYSQNEDALEVLVYMQEFDLDTAVRLLTEFIN